jgi:hypothetical protein
MPVECRVAPAEAIDHVVGRLDEHPRRDWIRVDLGGAAGSIPERVLQVAGPDHQRPPLFLLDDREGARFDAHVDVFAQEGAGLVVQRRGQHLGAKVGRADGVGLVRWAQDCTKVNQRVTDATPRSEFPPRRNRRAAIERLTYGVAAVGSVKLTAAPATGLFSAHSRPPWDSMMLPYRQPHADALGLGGEERLEDAGR